MSSLPFDPFRAERALHWRNRVGRWRADAAQTLLHAAALLALVALLAPPLLHGIEAAGPVLHAALQRWPLALGLAAFALLALRQAGRQHALRRREAREWWLAQPIAPALRRRRAWRIATLEAPSVLKKLKDKKFAAGVSREEVKLGAELLGVDLGEHIAFVIEALKEKSEEFGLTGQK